RLDRGKSASSDCQDRRRADVGREVSLPVDDLALHLCDLVAASGNSSRRPCTTGLPSSCSRSCSERYRQELWIGPDQAAAFRTFLVPSLLMSSLSRFCRLPSPTRPPC